MASVSHTRRILCILAWLVLLAGLVSVMPGSGVQSRLDARDGIKGEAFQKSLQRATQKMTRLQMESYNWAVSDLDETTFVQRYGTTPSVRAVIVGQVARFVDEGRKRAAFLDEQLQKIPGEWQAGERSYEQALDLLSTYRPVVTRVEYGKQQWGGGAEVYYELLNPNVLRQEALPCRLLWRGGPASIQQSLNFDCLAQKRATNGEYLLMIPGFRTDEPVKIETALEMCRPEPSSRLPAICPEAIALARDMPPELVEYWRIRAEMKRVLGYKASV